MNKEKKFTQLLIYYIELQGLLGSGTVDLNAINAKLKQIAAINVESHSIVIKSRANIKYRLTQEQLEMLKKIRSMDSLMGLPPFSRLI
jgi:Spy/CpxP family protein refolding chaperone